MKEKYEEIIYVAGMRKRITLTLKKEKHILGEYYILKVNPIPIKEMIKLSNKLNLPITDGKNKIFPEGKSVKDFLVSNS